ncbi:MAG: polysaccharide deacetylase family protein, partial [Vicinamibacterales bacterium]
MIRVRGPAATPADPRPSLNAFTVDLEDWFHVCGIDALAAPAWDGLPSRVVPTTTWLLDRLDHHSIRATFFVVGWIADRHPDLVHRIASAGHEIGSHSYWHRRVYELDPASFVDDVRLSCRAIAAAGVAHVDMFRAPEWSINERSRWALDELAALRFRLDASMAPLRMVGSLSFPREVHVRHTAHGPV